MEEVARNIEQPESASEPEGEKALETAISRKHSETLDEVDAVTADALRAAEGDETASRQIKTSAELSEKMIAETTKQARASAVEAFRKRVERGSAVLPYLHEKIPKITFLENAADPANDNARERLKTKIAEKEKRLTVFEGGRGAEKTDVEKQEALVAERELELLRKIEKKTEVVERIEETEEKIEALQSKVKAFEEKNVPEIDFESRIAEFKHEQIELIESVEADKAELFALGLSLPALDQFLTQAKNELRDLKSEEEGAAAEARRREEAQRLEAYAKRLEGEKVEKKREKKMAFREKHLSVRPGLVMGSTFGLLGAGIVKFLSFLTPSKIFHAIDSWFEWMFQTPLEKKIKTYWGVLTFDPKYNPLARKLFGGEKEKETRKSKK